MLDTHPRVQVGTSGAIQHLHNLQHKAESAEGYPNIAMQANVIDKMKDIQKDSRNGHHIPLEVMSENLCASFMDVNSGYEEFLHIY